MSDKKERKSAHRFQVQLKDKNPIKPGMEWRPVTGASHVTLTYAKGFVDGIRQFYPCPATRIVDLLDNRIVEENGGNGTPRVN